MKIAITGASGFIGQTLMSSLHQKGFEVQGVNRLLIFGNTEDLAAALHGNDVIINLAGAPIIQRWTNKNKRIIYNSRIVTTSNLTRAINLIGNDEKPKVFISASAVGIYAPGSQHDEKSSDLNSQFPGKVVKDWENASATLEGNVRRVVFRLALVLGKEAHFIKNLLPLFKLGLGGRLGNGKQAFPFIHIDDVAEAFYQAIVDENFNGIYNLAAPEQVTNKMFTNVLAGLLGKPSFLVIPDFMLRLLFGEASAMMTQNPAVIPERLVSIGFNYKYPTLSSAIRGIINDNS